MQFFSRNLFMEILASFASSSNIRLKLYSRRENARIFFLAEKMGQESVELITHSIYINNQTYKKFHKDTWKEMSSHIY